MGAKNIEMDTQDYKVNKDIEKIAKDVRETPDTSIRMFKRVLPILLMLLLAFSLWAYFHLTTCCKKTEDTTKEQISNTSIPTTTVLDEEAKLAQAKWSQTLGESTELVLPDGSKINVPANGFERKLVDYLQKGCLGDIKSTWFNCDRLLFQSGSANLNNVSLEQINALTTLMNAYPNAKFKVGGYTDNTGDATKNLTLSSERANAVMNAIVNAGVVANRLTAEGYGQKHPVCPNNDSEECKEKNRRVAIRVEQCK